MVESYLILKIGQNLLRQTKINIEQIEWVEEYLDD